MNRRSFVRSLAATGAGSFFGLYRAESQEPGDFIIRSDVNLVLLDVSVKDSRGQHVPDLAAGNFRIEEDGRPQMIQAFDHYDLPVTLGILVDESRSMTPTRGYVLVAAEALIDESNANDEIFVLNFNDNVTPGLPADMLFSDDRAKLHAALYRSTPEGRTAVHDVVVAGLRQLTQGQKTKKTLVLISDGGDNASAHTRRETMSMVERSSATIYTIGLFGPEDQDKDPGLLKELSRISGGEAYFPETVKQMLPVCHEIARDIRSRYTLGYFPPSGSNAALRHIRVFASAPGYGKLSTRTRSSYLYEESKDQK
jgi:VWFA-related protein